MLVLSTPLDTIAARLATLAAAGRLPARMLSRDLLWPAAGLALLALGVWEWRHGSGWGALMAAAARRGFRRGRADREAGVHGAAWDVWLFSRRNAIFAAIPFALFGAVDDLSHNHVRLCGGSFFVAPAFRADCLPS